jgi:hypothetical protein
MPDRADLPLEISSATEGPSGPTFPAITIPPFSGRASATKPLGINAFFLVFLYFLDFAAMLSTPTGSGCAMNSFADDFQMPTFMQAN